MKIIAVLVMSVVWIMILPAVSFLHASGKEWAGGQIRQDARPKKASFANPELEWEIKHETGEPPRVSRRLQFLRGWSHENNNEIFAGVP